LRCMIHLMFRRVCENYRVRDNCRVRDKKIFGECFLT